MHLSKGSSLSGSKSTRQPRVQSNSQCAGSATQRLVVSQAARENAPVALSDVLQFEESGPPGAMPLAMSSTRPESMNSAASTAEASVQSSAQAPPKVIRSVVKSKNRLSASYLDFGAAPTKISAPEPPPAFNTSPYTPGAPEGPALQRLPENQGQPASRALDFADHELPMQGFLLLRSQEQELADAARVKELPPLQSVLELTTAIKPPSKSLEAVAEAESATATESAVAAAAAVNVAGRVMPDGKGVLADGTQWEKKSGIELGANGFWKRWTLLTGSTMGGAVTWEECWWEASDWAGLKELGAAKSGTSLAGGAWKESWCEKAYHDEHTLEMVIERTAHKWARADGDSGEEWEEKWGEKHKAFGAVNKWADKWGKEGPNVWHEKWGEDYDGKGACTKWTDKWAEKDVGYGRREQWGDKWTEQFGHGMGEKHGEVWSANADGHRYNRWWNEQHYGNGQVRKWGDSTGGEYWDSTEWMDTYYNPVPHFGFHHAVNHSPDLWKVKERPRGVDDASPTSSSAGQPGSTQEDAGLAGLGAGLGALSLKPKKAPATGPLPDATPAIPASQLGMESTSTIATGGSDSATGSTMATPAPSPGDASRSSASSPAPASATVDASGLSLDWSEVLNSINSRRAEAAASGQIKQV